MEATPASLKKGRGRCLERVLGSRVSCDAVKAAVCYNAADRIADSPAHDMVPQILHPDYFRTYFDDCDISRHDHPIFILP